MSISVLGGGLTGARHEVFCLIASVAMLEIRADCEVVFKRLAAGNAPLPLLLLLLLLLLTR